MSLNLIDKKIQILFYSQAVKGLTPWCSTSVLQVLLSPFLELLPTLAHYSSYLEPLRLGAFHIYMQDASVISDM